MCSRRPSTASVYSHQESTESTDSFLGGFRMDSGFVEFRWFTNLPVPLEFQMVPLVPGGDTEAVFHRKAPTKTRSSSRHPMMDGQLPVCHRGGTRKALA